MTKRGAAALGAALCIVAAGLGPAAASTGGAAAATGAQAVAGEVSLEITTDGAIGGLQPVIDSLTADPVLAGQQLTLAQATTPAEPSGSDGGSIGTTSVGQVLALDGVTGRTERIENGDLTAVASIDGASVSLFGVDVLDIGQVTSRATAHPDDDPTATAGIEHLRVFGSPVDLAPGDRRESTLELSTDQVLDALGGLAPGLSGLTGFAGRVAGAGGRIDVVLSSDLDADSAAGAATAVGLNAQVHLSLDVRLCLPELRGDGCVGEVRVQTDTRVLDAQLAHSSVRRPAALEPGSPLGEYALPLAVLACLLASVAVYLGYRRTGRLDER